MIWSQPSQSFLSSGNNLLAVVNPQQKSHDLTRFIFWLARGKTQNNIWINHIQVLITFAWLRSLRQLLWNVILTTKLIAQRPLNYVKPLLLSYIPPQHVLFLLGHFSLLYFCECKTPSAKWIHVNERSPLSHPQAFVHDIIPYYYVMWQVVSWHHEWWTAVTHVLTVTLTPPFLPPLCGQTTSKTQTLLTNLKFSNIYI